VDLASERGAARLTSAARLAILLLILAVISFDLSAIVVNIFQLDDLSRSAASAGAQASRACGTRRSGSIGRSQPPFPGGAAPTDAVTMGTARGTLPAQTRRAGWAMARSTGPGAGGPAAAGKGCSCRMASPACAIG
jgi:hypothetical protein